MFSLFYQSVDCIESTWIRHQWLLWFWPMCGGHCSNMNRTRGSNNSLSLGLTPAQPSPILFFLCRKSFEHVSSIMGMRRFPIKCMCWLWGRGWWCWILAFSLWLAFFFFSREIAVFEDSSELPVVFKTRIWLTDNANFVGSYGTLCMYISPNPGRRLVKTPKRYTSPPPALVSFVSPRHYSTRFIRHWNIWLISPKTDSEQITIWCCEFCALFLLTPAQDFHCDIT